MAEKTVILTIGGTTFVNCAANTERTLSKKVKADYDVAPHGFNGFCDAGPPSRASLPILPSRQNHNNTQDRHSRNR